VAAQPERSDVPGSGAATPASTRAFVSKIVRTFPRRAQSAALTRLATDALPLPFDDLVAARALVLLAIFGFAFEGGPLRVAAFFFMPPDFAFALPATFFFAAGFAAFRALVFFAIAPPVM